MSLTWTTNDRRPSTVDRIDSWFWRQDRLLSKAAAYFVVGAFGYLGGTILSALLKGTLEALGR